MTAWTYPQATTIDIIISSAVSSIHNALTGIMEIKNDDFIQFFRLKPMPEAYHIYFNRSQVVDESIGN